MKSVKSKKSAECRVCEKFRIGKECSVSCEEKVECGKCVEKVESVDYTVRGIVCRVVNVVKRRV